MAKVIKKPKLTAIVKRTRSHSVSAIIRYLGDATTPAHNLADLRQRYRNNPNPKKLRFINSRCWHRNLALRGIGARTCGVKYTIKDFNKLAKKRPHDKVKTINIIISPSKGTIDQYDPRQVNAFADFCVDYVKKTFPNHLAYVAVQADNKHQIPHAHLIVSTLSTLSPYRSLKGNQYDINRLRRIYNQASAQFNADQDAIQLGPALDEFDKLPRPTKTDRYLIKNGKAVLDELQAGKLRNRTQLRKAFKKKAGIILKLTEHRHCRYLPNKDGKLVYHTDSKGRKHKVPLYKRYHSGDRKGQFMYRKNRHGHKVKVPVYRYTAGATFKPIKPVERGHYGYVNGSKLANLSNDSRFNGKWLLTTIYQIKKGTYEPTKSAELSESEDSKEASLASASAKASSAADNADSKLASERSSMANSATASTFASLANHRKASVKNSQAVQSQLRSLSSSYDHQRNNTIAYYAKQSLAIQHQQPAAEWARVENDYHNYQDNQRNYENAEENRVNQIMPKLNSHSSQQYASWAYQHAIPAKTIQYKSDIPEPDMKDNDRNLIQRLIDPIIKSFRIAKAKTWLIWHAGIRAIKAFLKRHHITDSSLGGGIAKAVNLLKRPFFLQKANRFHNVWPKINEIFNHLIGDQARKKLTAKRRQAQHTRDKHYNFYQQKTSEAMSNDNNQASALSQLHDDYSNSANSMASSANKWQSSFAFNTKAGSYAVANADAENIDSAWNKIASKKSSLISDAGNNAEVVDIKATYAPADRFLGKRERFLIKEALHEQGNVSPNGQDHNGLQHGGYDYGNDGPDFPF